MKDLEIWKIHKIDFQSSGLLVSNFGNIKMANFKDRKEGDNGNGYKLASVAKLGTKWCKKFYIHRLVAEHFLPQAESGKIQVNHIDGNKQNNHYTNLEWVCPKENIQHMHKEGLNKNRKELKNIFKASDKSVANAYLSVKIGMYGVREAADKYGMPRTTLSSIMNKRSRRSVTDTIDNYFMFTKE